MKAISLSLGLASALWLAGSLPAQAQTAEGAGYRAYQCAVQGDRSVCDEPAAQAPVRTEERLEPGPYARYLMSQGGLSEDKAIAQARGTGEYPVRRVVRVTTRELSPLEKYERIQGQTVAPEQTEQTLSVVVDKSIGAPAPRAQAESNPRL